VLTVKKDYKDVRNLAWRKTLQVQIMMMQMMSNSANSGSDQNNSLLYSPDRIRIFVENPLQNTNVMHIKMKMPPKVYCMRINRAVVSMA